MISPRKESGLKLEPFYPYIRKYILKQIYNPICSYLSIQSCRCIWKPVLTLDSIKPLPGTDIVSVLYIDMLS